MNDSLKPPVMPFEIDVTDIATSERDVLAEYRAGLTASGDVYLTGSSVDSETGRPIEIDCMPVEATDPNHDAITARLRRVMELLPLDNEPTDDRAANTMVQ